MSVGFNDPRGAAEAPLFAVPGGGADMAAEPPRSSGGAKEAAEPQGTGSASRPPYFESVLPGIA